jgi:hypothetical protein
MGRTKRRHSVRLGAPHRRYRAPWIAGKLEDLFPALSYSMGYGELSRIARRYGIPIETLRRWRKHLQEDPDWRPTDTRWGQHRRIFTAITESAMSAYIRTEFIEKHRLFATEDFRMLAFETYRQVYQNSDDAPRFTCSGYFVKDFMKRNRFALRRQHFKRRPRVTAEVKNQWSEALRSILATHDNDHILNCDETAWRLYPNNILTWWPTGTDDVSIHVDGNEKGCITVLATITASHKKLPLFFLAKGKTERVDQSQIGIVEPHWRAHSESGWMRSNLFCAYLRHVRNEIADDEEIILVCDLHASHRSEDVKSLAAALKIRLVYIPAGATDELQPLDKVVFGALKSEARRIFRQRVADNLGLKRSKRDAVADMITAWDWLSDEAIRAAWQSYQGEEEWDEPDASGSE